MTMLYNVQDTNLNYQHTKEPSKYERNIEQYGATLLDISYNVPKVKKISDNEGFSFSTVLINLVKDGLDENEVDFKKLKKRFEDVVFTSLSLLDDYLLETSKKDFFSISDDKFNINHVFSEMILSNISIHPSTWNIIGKTLILELEENLKKYGNFKLQTGELCLYNDKVYIYNSSQIKPVKRRKSKIKIVEL